MRLVLTVLAVTIGVIGCGAAGAEEETGSLAIALTPLDAVHRGTNAFTVDLRDPTGAPIGGAMIDAIAEMPAMGHSSTATIHVSEIGSGNYRIDDVVLPMPGSWDVKVLVTCHAGHEAKTFRYEVP